MTNIKELEWIVDAVEPIHHHLMKESSLYRQAVENRLVWLVLKMQFSFVQQHIEKHDSSVAGDEKK